MTTPGPTTPAARWRSALLVLGLVLAVLMLVELGARNLVAAVVCGVLAAVCVVAGARPRGAS